MHHTQASVETSKHVHRMHVVQSFLISGTPLSRLQYFKSVLERDGFTIPDAKNLASTYIEKIELRELQRVREELDSQFIGIAFDGTSRLGEAVCITGRSCTSDFQLHTRLIRFITSKLHLNGANFARVITNVLCRELSFFAENIVSFSRDSVLVNASACRLLVQSPFIAAEDHMCMAHTLNNVGSRINFELLQEFMSPWLELVGGRHPHRGAQALWRSAVQPTSVPGFSNVRWHSKAEIEFVIAEHFDKLRPFLSALDEHGYGDATRQKMHQILDNEAKAKKLGLQLAAMLDMRCLVSTTYELEGDRLELLLLYERIERLRALGKAMLAGDAGVLSNLDAALRSRVQLKSGVKVEKVSMYCRSLQPHVCHLTDALTAIPHMHIGVRRLWSVHW